MTLLTALKATHAEMQNPENWTHRGICNELGYEEREEFYLLYKRWPKYSGDQSFPVPSAIKDARAAPAYLRSVLDFAGKGYMWDRKNSPYAALRWELLEWAINELEKEQSYD